MLKFDYAENGIEFELSHEGKPVLFPLNLGDIHLSGIDDTPEWGRIIMLEQLWRDGKLCFNDDKYLLTTEEAFSLDEDDIMLLGLPEKRLNLSINETGNVGSREYSFSYKYLYRGNLLRSPRRSGNIVSGNGTEFWLDRQQYRLLELVDNYSDAYDVEARSRYYSMVKNYAINANAKLDKSITDRDFIFVENAGLGVEKITDQELIVHPSLSGVDDRVSSQLVGNLSSRTIYHDSVKDYRIFIDDDCLSKCEKISKIDNIKGAKVPAFIKNPYQFIPDDVEFDEAEFAERVKGLKIIVSKAMPSIKIDESNQSGGWLDYSAEVVVESEDDDQPGWKIDDYREFKKILDQAITNDEPYVYYKGQWVKADQNTRDFIDAKEKADKVAGDGPVSKGKAREILDIYENIEFMEYDEETRSIFDNLRNPLMYYDVPGSFALPLDDYQVEGYNFMMIQRDKDQGCLMADDMGLGKTAQVIALIAALKENNALKPLLVVVPTVLIENWEAELGKFLPSLNNIYIHKGAKRLNDYHAISRFDLTIVSYETLARDQVLLGRVHWSYVICDEVQKIKNFNTFASSAVKGMNAKHRIAMTGTPIENNLSELWSIMDFIQPGLLGSNRQFRIEFEKPLKQVTSEAENQRIVDSLLTKIKSYFIRRSKDDVLKDVLPEKREIYVKAAFSDDQREKYVDLIENVKLSGKQGAHLAAVQKLIEICSHPRLLDTRSSCTTKQLIDECPKLGTTIAIINEVKLRNEKVIIFTRYKYMQAILRKVIFDVFNVDADIINGEATNDRMEQIHKFQSVDGFNALILSPKAAGIGLNITGANNVIHYTREWNPAVENQATDRVYRRGQNKDVNVYYPIVEDSNFTTAEVKLDELLSSKKKLMKDVIIVNGMDVQKEMESLLS